MNRHERRAAAARARRARRTGYLHRIMAGLDQATVGLHIAHIEHEPGCGIYRGTGCDCIPDISVNGPDGLSVIDIDGSSRKVARQ
jgi:hypothetical protein